MLLLCLLAAYVALRVSSDLPYALRGKTPPRHEYRMAKLRHAAEHGGTPLRASAFGRYCAGVVNDSWESAIQRRELMAEVRAERQARRIERRIQAAHRRQALADQRHHRRELQRAERDRVRQRHQVQPPTPAADQDTTPPTASDKANTTAPSADAHSDTAPSPTGTSAAARSTAAISAPHTAGTDHPTKKGNPMPNAETTGLDAAITYAKDMQDYCARVAEQVGAAAPETDTAGASCEQALTNLRTGGVTGTAIDVITQAQEQLLAAANALASANAQMEAAQAAFTTAHTELQSHIGVREAYNATPGAGSKEFVTAG